MDIKATDNLGSRLFPFGCTVEQGTVYFCVAVRGEKLSLRLYQEGRHLKSIAFSEKLRIGDVWRLGVTGIPLDGTCSYTYMIDGRELEDPYGTISQGREAYKAGHKRRVARTVITDGEDLRGRAAASPRELSDSVIYRLHVRGFTRDRSSGIPQEDRGTFAGVASRLDYIKELGITAIELMPAYEYEELMPSRGRLRVNYWGFTPDAMRMSPKASFGGEAGFVDLVEKVHEAGMELIMGLYFTGAEPEDYVLTVVRSWRLRYGVDGVHIVGYAPMKLLLNDPYLRGMKIFSDRVREEDLSRSMGISDRGLEMREPSGCQVAAYNDDFQNDIRRFIKGDEGMVDSMIGIFRDIPKDHARIDYTANVSGFSLMDVFSYDQKHNEQNGEHDSDGTDYNYSWNCGEEGPSRKKRINELRRRLCRNALLLTILCPGTPLINAGDEMGHTKKGNNNSWCQDSSIEWLNWEDLRKHGDIYEFTKRLIALRREHPVFRRKGALKGSDYLVTGLPDISFHGMSAWKVDHEHFRRQLCVCLNGAYAAKEDGDPDDSFYILMNMHWESHRFYVPRLPAGKSWKLLVDTSLEEPFCEAPLGDTLDEDYSIQVPARSIIILTGK